MISDSALHPPRPHAHPASQDSIAHSIAREVQARVPVSGTLPGLDAAVEASIEQQGLRTERAVAWVRTGAMSALAAVALLGWLLPGLVEVGRVSGTTVVVIGFLAACAAALLVGLLRGWHPPRLRQVVPAADALLIGIPTLLFVRDALTGASLVGIAAVAVMACAGLAFSGAVRMSHSSQRISTALAAGTWLVLAWAMAAPPLIALFIAALLVGLGVLGAHFGGTVRTIVAQEIADQRLQSLYADARAAVEAREEVLKVVAHDLRNPLNTIGMTAQLLRDPPADADSDRYVDVITRCSASMNRIIQDLLEVARMEAGRLTIERTSIAPAELLEAVDELMRPIAEEQQVGFRSEAGPADLRIHADAFRLQQVFSNLIGNAIKFTPAGGSVEVRAQRVGDRVRFSVLDTGPGVPPERAERLFERFWQANEQDRRGIGLGLAIARSIVEAHGGRIGVEPRSTGGSEFWFTIPAAEPASFQPQAATSTPVS